MRGHMRVGFENNLLPPDGSTALSNAALIATCADAIRALGLHLATADDLRAAWRSMSAG
jgi:3-keto-5-aminohexanoate cleavage enzyme